MDWDGVGMDLGWIREWVRVESEWISGWTKAWIGVEVGVDLGWIKEWIRVDLEWTKEWIGGFST